MDRRWILSGVLVAGGIGVVRALTYRPKLDENSRILVIGDSLARGMSPHFAAIADEENLPLVGIAINGTTIRDWINSSELRQKLSTFEPTHVFISLGTNDAYTNFTPEDVADDAQELVEIIEETGAHPIWIGMPPLPRFYNSNEINPETLMAVKDTAPYFYDSSDLDIPRGPDGLHPTVAGYAGWTGEFWNWIS